MRMSSSICFFFFFFFNDTATTEIYTLSLHDALPISCPNSSLSNRPSGMPPRLTATSGRSARPDAACSQRATTSLRSEEHTSELQSQSNLVCRLLLEKKKNQSKATESASLFMRVHILF